MATGKVTKAKEKELDVEDMIQVANVADGQPEDLNFGKLFIRRKSRQKLPQVRKGRVERLDSNSFLKLSHCRRCVIICWAIKCKQLTREAWADRYFGVARLLRRLSSRLRPEPLDRTL